MTLYFRFVIDPTPARSVQFRELDDELAEKKREDARKRSVPPKRLFDPTGIKEEDLERWGITSRRDHRDRDKTVHEYEGFQFKGSFLTKFLPIRSLFTGPDILPELDELKIFEQGRDDSERGTRDALTSIHRRRIVLQKGDSVRVKQGELQNLLGKVLPPRAARRPPPAAHGRDRTPSLYDVSDLRLVLACVFVLARPRGLTVWWWSWWLWWWLWWRPRFGRGDGVLTLAGWWSWWWRRLLWRCTYAGCGCGVGGGRLTRCAGRR
jgi:hypothetical protein